MNKMEKLEKIISSGITALLLGTTSILLGITVVGALKTSTATEYSMNGYVVSVLEGERQLIETEDGNVWEVTDEPIWVTDEVIVTFSDNGTSDITDDEIIKVEKVVD